MRRVSGFTLVELLVVIAIMIIIMGFSVPMFSKISFGNAVDGASRMISSQLSLARAEAVAKRQYIAIIMPGKDFNQPSDDSNGDYHFRAFRAAIVEDDEDGEDNTYNFKEWFPGTEWNFLPKGAVIAQADERVEAKNETRGIECVFDDYSKTDGRITKRHINDSKGDDSWLEDGNKLGVEKQCTTVTLNGKNVRAVVFLPNGRVSAKTKYVTIVEGIVAEEGSATNPDYKLINGNLLNMRILRVGRLTGKVTYVDPEYDSSED